MNKFLIFSIAAMVALVANQAMAQCVGCANNGPVFNQSQAYSAPMNYGTPSYAVQSYGAPSYSPQVYSAPGYGDQSYGAPMYNSPVVDYQQPCCGSSNYPTYDNTFVNAPVYDSGYSYGCPSCGCSSCGDYNSTGYSAGYSPDYSQGYGCSDCYSGGGMQGGEMYYGSPVMVEGVPMSSDMGQAQPGSTGVESAPVDITTPPIPTPSPEPESDSGLIPTPTPTPEPAGNVPPTPVVDPAGNVPPTPVVDPAGDVPATPVTDSGSDT